MLNPASLQTSEAITLFRAGFKAFFSMIYLASLCSRSSSAYVCFRQRFSSFKAFNSESSDAPIPPYFLRQLYNVAFETLFSRATLAANLPESRSLRILTICDSVDAAR